MSRIAFSMGLLVALTAQAEVSTNVQKAFGGARWMWPAELGAVTNTTVEFRTTFRAARETPLKLAIAADTVYAVELNGRFVHTGRFPDVPPQRYFDTRPIGTSRAGENELLVRLYVQGVNTFQTIPGDPGLMYAVSGEGVRVESGADVDWRVSARDRRGGVPMVTGQLGFSFEHDAAAPDAPWRRIGADDARRGCGDFDLSPRPVSPVEVLPPVESKVIGQGLLDGSPVPAKVAPGMDATVMTPLSAERFFTADGRGVRPESFARGFYVLLDLGREEAGFLTLDVEADAGTVIDVGHAEHSENGRITTFVGGRNFAGRYRCREGRQQYFRWARRMAGRYLQLHVRGARTRFALHGATVRPAVYPVAERPAPSGLTDLQRKIWDVSVRTLRLCMHEHYEDCPWREQALYGNDARNQMLCGYYAFPPDNRMPELALTVHGRGVNEDGWQTMCMPAHISLVIPSFTFCWVLAVDDNLRHRGDPAFTATLMPAVRKVLETHVREMHEGLLPCPAGKRYWQFYEWSTDMAGDLCGPDYVKPGEWRYESPLNLFFVLALDAGARCAAATGDAQTASRWRETAGRLRTEVGRRFWNEKGKFLDMRLGKALRPSEFTQSLALLADVVPPEERTGVARRLMTGSEWTEITLSQTLYKYEALIAASGEAAAAVVPKMDAEWKRMLDAGATSFWEMREGWPAFGNAGSLCHGWSAIPVYVYGAYPQLR